MGLQSALLAFPVADTISQTSITFMEVWFGLLHLAVMVLLLTALVMMMMLTA